MLINATHFFTLFLRKRLGMHSAFPGDKSSRMVVIGR
jgi:hypothetical protein